MSPSSKSEWVVLRDFDDPVLAGDVITSILAMEFDAVLVDLASSSVVAGNASDEPAGDEPIDRPFHIQPSLGDYDPVLGAVGHEAHVLPEGDRENRTWSAEDGGPWRLMIPADLHGELAPLLDVIIEEQQKFNADHHDLQRTQARIRRFVLGVVLVFLAILALRFTGLI
ncbi:MAG: hypothetical protein VX641_02085 [Planctomycetota bacterium]|nr:hypothetical protein [Planctomycetota bacterium]